MLPLWYKNLNTLVLGDICMSSIAITKALVIAAIAAVMIVGSLAVLLSTYYNSANVASAATTKPPAPGKGGTTPGQSHCTSNADCPTDLVCVNGLCGTCSSNSQCRTGQTCTNGACVSPPPGTSGTSPGKLKCSSSSQCTSGQVCTNGYCGGCPTGQTACNGQCVDTQKDNNNCGTCGTTCGTTSGTPQGSTCQSGTCSCGGSTPLLDSGGTKCVATCGPNEIAQNGKCTACPAGTAVCASSPNTCTSLSSSPNCGACGKTCATGTSCQPSGGTFTCQVSCASGQTNCNGVCVDLLTSSSNCGACGRDCSGSAAVGTTGACVGGKCECTSAGSTDVGCTVGAICATIGKCAKVEPGICITNAGTCQSDADCESVFGAGFFCAK
jgi:hypothetical protein